MLSMHVDTNVPSFARSFQDVACKVSENKVRIYSLIEFVSKSLDFRSELRGHFLLIHGTLSDTGC